MRSLQGQQALEAIAKAGVQAAGALDVLIVGAGPAGLAASLAAKKMGLNYQTVEQDSLGGAVFQYPRGKLVMTAPVELPIVGKVQFRNTSKEELLKFWTDACKGNWLEDPLPASGGGHREARTACFMSRRNGTAATPRRPYCSAIGRRGTPRKLGVPGEELPKVVYRLIDPEQYRGQKVIVVGGGDSALEAAASIAELGDTAVMLSYRGEAFQRAKQRNRQRVEEASAKGRLKVLFNSQIREIRPESVALEAIRARD